MMLQSWLMNNGYHSGRVGFRQWGPPIHDIVSGIEQVALQIVLPLALKNHGMCRDLQGQAPARNIRVESTLTIILMNL